MWWRCMLGAVGMVGGLAGCTGRTTVVIEVGEMPTLIGYRDGARAWQIPKPQPGGQLGTQHFDLAVSDEFQLMVAWGYDDGSWTATELYANASDSKRWYVYADASVVLEGDVHGPGDWGCISLPGPIPVTFRTIQPMTVNIGGRCVPTTAGGGINQVGVEPGMHDILATDGSRVSITRGVDIEAATALPTIDLSVTGVALGSRDVLVANSAPLELMVDVQLDGEVAVFPTVVDSTLSTRHAAPTLPAALVEPGDLQLLSLFTQDPAGALQLASTLDVATTQFTVLPEPAHGFSSTSGVDAAAWTEALDPRVQAARVGVLQSSGHGVFAQRSTIATASWIHAQHVSSLGFEYDGPGYDPGWTIDVASPRQTTFEVSARERDVSYTTYDPQQQ